MSSLIVVNLLIAVLSVACDPGCNRAAPGQAIVSRALVDRLRDPAMAAGITTYRWSLTQLAGLLD